MFIKSKEVNNPNCEHVFNLQVFSYSLALLPSPQLGLSFPTPLYVEIPRRNINSFIPRCLILRTVYTLLHNTSHPPAKRIFGFIEIQSPIPWSSTSHHTVCDYICKKKMKKSKSASVIYTTHTCCCLQVVYFINETARVIWNRLWKKHFIRYVNVFFY